MKTKTFGNIVSDPKLSIVVVTYNTGSELISCLESLSTQSENHFETILVDNGNILEDSISKFKLTYIHTGSNLGPSEARNIGLNISKSGIVAFLDDDAVADKNWVKSILDTLKDKDVIGLRGKIFPKNPNNHLNLMQSHYNLGDRELNYFVDLEGNSAFKKDYLVKSGGFRKSLFGHEGPELSYRIKNLFPNKRIVYSPKVIIYHEYADNLFHLLSKSFRHGYMSGQINEKLANIESYTASFKVKKTSPKKTAYTIFLSKVRNLFSILGRIKYKLVRNITKI